MYQLFEIYTVYEDGEEELVDTTGSLSNARQMAEDLLADDEVVDECVIYEENEDGELIEVDRIRRK